MNAEFMVGDAMVWLGARGAGAGAAAGIERSRRSFRPEEDAAGLGALVLGDVNDEKSPNPLVLGLRFCDWVWVMAGALEDESKKLPPPPNMLEEEVIGGDFALE